MQLFLGWKDIIYIFSMFIGFLIGLILLVHGIKKNKTNLALSLSFLALTYAVFLAWLISSGYHTYLPQLYRTGNIAAMLYAPFTYLYISQVIEERSWKSQDLIHLIPALVYLIDFFPVIFMLSTDDKLILVQSEIANPSIFTRFNQSRIFPPDFYPLVRTILISAYWLASFRLLWKHGRKVADLSRFFGKEWVLWMKTLLFLEILIFLPFFVLVNFVDPSIGFDLIHFTASITLLTSGIALLFFPKVLYGLNEFEFILHTQEEHTKSESPGRLTGEKETEIQEKLKVVLNDQKGYLKNGYTISDLAKDTGIPAYLLTQYINRKLETSFSELINQKRIEACCHLMESGQYKHLTLEGLAELCGFNNRNSFSAAFKKFKGMTPSQFQKSILLSA
jgi:AraC-like DNA-binding protein